MDAATVPGRDLPRRGLAVAALVALTGVALSLTGAWWELRRTREAAAEVFERDVDTLAATVELELRRYASAALAASAVVGARPRLTRDEYERAMGRVGVGSSLPAVTAVNYLAYVPMSTVRSFVERRRRDGDPDFAIHPVRPDARQYAPVTFLHPRTAANAGALGFDALSNARARAAMRASRTLGVPLLSDGLRIVQEREDQTGIIIYVPVDDRAGRFLGWTNAVFRGQEFLDGIVSVDDRVALRITDATPDGPRVIGSLPAGHEFSVADTLRSTRTIELFGQRWQAEFEALPGLATDSERRAPWVVLLGGLTGTAILVALATVIAGSERRALAAVADRTADLVSTNAELQRANSIKDAFMANMSHEIRTPLNGVVGVTQVLETTSLDERQRRLLGLLQTAGRQLTSVVDAVLDLSCVERGDVTIDAVEFDIAAPVTAVVTLFADAASRNGVTLTSDVASDVPAVVRGDVVRVRQILANLVGNAVRYTPDGSIAVRVRPAGRADTVRFEVIDTGIGVPADARTRIFEPFVQADVSDTRRYGGTGLGLTICKGLVTALGGTIGFHSREGVGSTFWVELPLPDARPVAASQRLGVGGPPTS